MHKGKRILTLLSLLVIASMLIAACGGASDAGAGCTSRSTRPKRPLPKLPPQKRRRQRLHLPKRRRPKRPPKKLPRPPKAPIVPRR